MLHATLSPMVHFFFPLRQKIFPCSCHVTSIEKIPREATMHRAIHRVLPCHLRDGAELFEQLKVLGPTTDPVEYHPLAEALPHPAKPEHRNLLLLTGRVHVARLPPANQTKTNNCSNGRKSSGRGGAAQNALSGGWCSHTLYTNKRPFLIGRRSVGQQSIMVYYFHLSLPSGSSLIHTASITPHPLRS